jgi:hypothetical protein
MKRQITILAVALIAAFAFASSAQATPSLVGTFCHKGVLGGQCDGPQAIAVSPVNGDLYVIDNDRVNQFSPWGEFIRAWGGGVVTGGGEGTGELVEGSTTVSSVQTTSKVFMEGMALEGEGIAPGTRIAAVGNGTLTLTEPANATTPTTMSSPEAAGNVPVNELQRITVTATAGTFNLTFQSPAPDTSTETTTANLPYNASAAEVQTALDGLAEIDPGDVTVTSANPGGVAGVPGGPYLVEFAGRYVDTDVRGLRVAAGTPPLTGGSVVVEPVRQGASAPEVCTVAGECRPGVDGIRAGQFGGAYSIAIDSTGAIYVEDLASCFGGVDCEVTFRLLPYAPYRVQKFDSEGNFELMFGRDVNEGGGSPSNPGDICTAEDLANGDICGPGTPGSGAGQFEFFERGGNVLAVGADDTIFVGGRERIQVFDAGGHFVKSISVPGESISGLGVDASPTSPSYGAIFAIFRNSFTSPPFVKPDVRRIDAETGEVVGSLKAGRPSAIALTPTGRVFVFDGANPTPIIREYDPLGNEAQSFGKGELQASIGLATSTACGVEGANLYAAHQSGVNPFINLYGTAPDANLCPPPAAAPSIEAQFATAVATTDAALRAKINPHFWPDTRYRVEYGTGKCSEGGCDKEQPASPGALLTKETIDAALTTPEVFVEGLAPNTTYHYRFLAESSGGGPTVGEELSFRTLPLPGEGNSACPNQAFRTGAAAKLPDCRAYEMVSPLDKQNGDIATGGGGFAQTAFDGGRMTFSSFRSFADPESAPLNHQYLATRGAGGWATASIAPPDTSHGLFGAGATVDAIRYKDFSDDLCLGWTIQSTDVALTPESPPGVANLYRRDLCAGGYELLTSSPPPGFGRGEELTSSYTPELQGTSTDGARAAFRANASLPTQAGDPRAPLRCIADKDADTVSFAWLRGGISIPGAEADEYTPTIADEGTALQCRTASSGPAGTSVATGAVMAIGPEETPRAPRPPKVAGATVATPVGATVTGTPEVGGTLTCTPGAWQGEPAFAFRWLRNDTQIAGAESPEYTLVDADASAVVQCELVASNAGGTAIGDSLPVLVDGAPPLAGAPPTISGTPEVGQTLTCDPGAWAGNPTFAYRWLRNGAEILIGAGAAPSRAVVAADAGKTLQCRVTATNADAKVMATSDRVVVPAAPATDPPQQSAPGSLSGIAAVGQTLTCDPGTWSGSPTFAYKWLRDGALIAGAGASSYALQEADAGAAVQCQVSATNAGGTTLAIEGSAGGVRYLAPDPAPEAPPAAAYSYSVFQVYLAHEGGLSLVSVLPDGTPSTVESSVGTSQTGSNFTDSARIGNPRINAVHQAVSVDGERVFWTSGAFGQGDLSTQGQVYLRVNATQPQSAVVAGECTESEKACTLPVSELATPEPARFLDADTEGTRALFAAGGKLYEYVGGPAPQATEIAGGFEGFLGASRDATRAYFTSTEVLTGAQENSEGDRAKADKANLYLHEIGEGLTFVAALHSIDGGNSTTELTSGSLTPERRSARVSPDGNTVAFTTRGRLTDYDSLELTSEEPAKEVYLYDNSEGRLICASCNPSGARPRARNQIPGAPTPSYAAATIPGWVSQTHPGGALSEDGQRLYFNAYDSLVPGDTNGKADVYQWEAPGKGDCTEASDSYSSSNGGCIALISSGQSSSDSELFDATPSGSDVFFSTSSSLVPQDSGLVDVYDARVNGGFAPPPTPPASCEGEACQGTPTPPNDPTPASASFQGAGNVAKEPASKPRCSKGKARRKGRCVKQQKSSKAKKHAKAGRAAADRRNAR